MFSCLQPLRMAKLNGRMTFNIRFVPEESVLSLPCGKCANCLREYSNQWSYRLYLESKQYKNNCFVTLTYDQQHLKAYSLIKRDYQLFIKRLRKSLPEEQKIRYFLCGEYGSEKNRPHFHIIIFNYKPNDLEFVKKSDRGQDLFRSRILEKIWNNGIVSVQDFEREVSLYCTKYLQKLQWQDKSQYFSEENGEILLRPFVAMSNGIGKCAIDSKMLETDKIYIDGFYSKLPRYFLDKLSVEFPNDVQRVKNNRLVTAVLLKNIEKNNELYNNFSKSSLNIIKK